MGRLGYAGHTTYCGQRAVGPLVSSVQCAGLSVPLRVGPDNLPDPRFHLGVRRRANEIVLTELPREDLTVLRTLLRESAQYGGRGASRSLFLSKAVGVPRTPE